MICNHLELRVESPLKTSICWQHFICQLCWPTSVRGSWEGLVPLFVLQFAPSRTFSRTSARRWTQGRGGGKANASRIQFSNKTKLFSFPRRTISESKNLPHGEKGGPTKVGNKSCRNDLR